MQKTSVLLVALWLSSAHAGSTSPERAGTLAELEGRFRFATKVCNVPIADADAFEAEGRRFLYALSRDSGVQYSALEARMSAGYDKLKDGARLSDKDCERLRKEAPAVIEARGKF